MKSLWSVETSFQSSESENINSVMVIINICHINYNFRDHLTGCIHICYSEYVEFGLGACKVYICTVPNYGNYGHCPANLDVFSIMQI